MCIIAIKPIGQFDTLARNYLRRCFDNNPDGAGYMYQVEGGVQVSKGYMEWEQLADVVDTLPTDRVIVFHFRWATHGQIVPELCHPFPVTRKRKQSLKLDTIASCAIVHNGIIANLGKSGADGDTSDTLELATGLLPLLGKALHNLKTWTQLAKLTNSKFCFMDATQILYSGASVREGEWLFSNSGYRECVNVYPKSTKALTLALPTMADDDGAYYLDATVPMDDDDLLLAQWEREWNEELERHNCDDSPDVEDATDAYLRRIDEQLRAPTKRKWWSLR